MSTTAPTVPNDDAPGTPGLEVDDDGFEVDPALAASLGFSSFGSRQVGAKRRKFARDDAVVDIVGGRGGANGKKRGGGGASGGNSVALGVRRERDGGNADVVVDAETAPTTVAPPLPTGLPAGIQQAAPMHAEQPDAVQGQTGVDVELKPGVWPTQQQLQALRSGVRDARGDVAYFLPSFVEDPWAALREKRG